MVVTDDAKLYERLCLFRSHGITRAEGLMGKQEGGWYYEQLELGYNYRMTDIQAALGGSQLAKLDAFIQRRRYLAGRYTEAFARLREAGIGVNVHYIPVYHHPYYRKHGYQDTFCPHAEQLYQHMLSLPLYPGLTEEQQDVVIEQVKKLV